MLQPQQPPQQQFAAQPDGATAMGNPRRVGSQLGAAALTQMKWLSFSQVVIGGLCILFGIILIPVKASMSSWGPFIVAGSIICGAYFAIVGGVGLGAFAYNTIRWIIATMVLNIISSAVFSIQLITMPSGYISSCESYISSSCSAKNVAVSLNILLVPISIAEFSIAIWSAVLCCRAICTCCLPVHPNRHVQDAYPAHLTQRQNLDFSAVVPDYQINAGGYQAASALVHKQPPSG